MSAASAGDVWAVGGSLIEHWDGAAWSIVASPAVAGGYLNAVAARTAGDAWAVGTASFGPSATLVEHWNGSEWKVVPSPNVGTSSRLSGLAAVSASNLWAVGVSTSGPLTLHWNGTKWAVVTAPSVNGGWLYAVTALSASNVWAVGRYGNATLGAAQTLIEHWNGSKWAVVPSPDATTASGPVDNVLFGVLAIGPGNVWAVGDVNWDPTGDQYHTVIEHWNGTAWHLITGPTIPKSTNDALFAITSVPGAAHLWAVGYATPSGNGAPLQPLTEFRC